MVQSSATRSRWCRTTTPTCCAPVARAARMAWPTSGTPDLVQDLRGGGPHPGPFTRGEDENGGRAGVLTRENSRVCCGCHGTPSCYRCAVGTPLTAHVHDTPRECGPAPRHAVLDRRRRRRHGIRHHGERCSTSGGPRHRGAGLGEEFPCARARPRSACHHVSPRSHATAGPSPSGRRAGGATGRDDMVVVRAEDVTVLGQVLGWVSRRRPEPRPTSPRRPWAPDGHRHARRGRGPAPGLVRPSPPRP